MNSKDARNEARRKEMQPEVVRLYAGGFGHKAIASKLGVSARIARTILIEAGVWMPGSLAGGEQHRKLLSAAKQAAIPQWKREEKRLESERQANNRKVSDLPLFRWGGIMRRRRTGNELFTRKYKEDPTFKVTHVLRSRIRKVVDRGNRYSGESLAWLGCTPIELIAHIERQWTDGMSWDNYGCKEGQWSIDHIRPCASFDMLREEERAACFHFSNMQPLWHVENVAKGAKWPIRCEKRYILKFAGPLKKPK